MSDGQFNQASSTLRLSCEIRETELCLLRKKEHSLSSALATCFNAEMRAEKFTEP